MLSLEMLDVVIGIIFIYLLLSLICTSVNEAIEAKLKLRAVDLEQGIRKLLNDPDGKGIVTKVYNHPLVSNLFRSTYDTSQIRRKANAKDTRYSRGSDLPSYIPSKNFALALMNVLLPEVILPDENGGNKSLLPLRNAVEGITNNDQVKKALLSIIDGAGDDINRVRAGIEGWFNSSMDRVAGWYKRRVQQIIFVLGFVVSIAMNADSFAIFNNLVNDRPLRSSIVAAAQNLKDNQPDTAKQTIQKNVNELLQLGLPIGWNWKSDLNPHAKLFNPIAIPEFSSDHLGSSVWVWIIKICGWLVTGFAVSLGAPFWFDMLNKIMVIRSTIKPHEKSLEEPSKDK